MANTLIVKKMLITVPKVNKMHARIRNVGLFFVLLCVVDEIGSCKISWLRMKMKMTNDYSEIVDFLSPSQSFSRVDDDTIVATPFTEPSTDDIRQIEERTRGQPDKLYAEMRLRITADLFGPICLAKTPDEAMAAWVMSPRPRPDVWKNQPILRLLREVIKEPMRQSGIIVPRFRGYLAAIPDGLIGNSKVVKVYIAQQPRKIFFPTKRIGVEELSSEENLYYEIQGLLTITRTQECILVIISKGTVKTTVVKRDEVFWRNKMLPKINHFYQSTLLPELSKQAIPRVNSIPTGAAVIRVATTHLPDERVSEILAKKDGLDTLMLESYFNREEEWKAMRKLKIQLLKRAGKEVSWDFEWDTNRRQGEPRLMKQPTSFSKSAKRKGTAEELDRNKPSVSRHIYLVRHGQYNQREDPLKEDLTPVGKHQAKLTGERFKSLGIPFVRIIHSTMVRAIETASIIHEYLPDVPMVSESMITEGVPSRPDPPLEGWEVDEEALSYSAPRIEAAFQKYFYRASPTQKEDSFEIIVAHGMVLQHFICRLMQISPEAWSRMKLNDASISHMQIGPDGRVGIRSFGDCGHLDPESLTRG